MCSVLCSPWLIARNSVLVVSNVGRELVLSVLSAVAWCSTLSCRQFLACAACVESSRRSNKTKSCRSVRTLFSGRGRVVFNRTRVFLTGKGFLPSKVFDKHLNSAQYEIDLAKSASCVVFPRACECFDVTRALMGLILFMDLKSVSTTVAYFCSVSQKVFSNHLERKMGNKCANNLYVMTAINLALAVSKRSFGSS